MDSQSYATSFTVNQSPDEVYAAIADVARWWTGKVVGLGSRVGDEFTYVYPDLHYSRQRVTNLVPGERVVWRVVDSKLAFVGDPSEWTGTDISFDIAEQGGQTIVRFAHEGLVPRFECYDNCSNAWSFFINGSLRRLITTGEGPTPPPWA
ncbi:SRPBCC domain-containing protein [Micromonospora maritima]|uniref:SRPBCC domain-containing protein n=1 Tax=Micromonospora maritima TaxID=986711 RepID=A0ABW7ZJI1_9ACTN